MGYFGARGAYALDYFLQIAFRPSLRIRGRRDHRVVPFGDRRFAVARRVFPCAGMLAILAVGSFMRIVRNSFESARDKLMLSRDLELGRAVQALLLPEHMEGETATGWKYRVSFKPYGAMSGDWVKVYHTPSDAPKAFSVIAMGDVVGKVPGAALVTAADGAGREHGTSR